ncbi:MAG: ATP-binding cassette domain-containing protein [Eubacteriales bacterium]|nr:ATP-binding cassette domain-containing protein [Eubacteriales bacterium]
MLKIENIHKTFNQGTINEKIALDGLSLHLQKGCFACVIGSNGAGKSSLMNAVSGVWKVDSGKILIDNIDVTNLPCHKRASFIGRVFQDPMVGTASNMLIEENLSIAKRRGHIRTLNWYITKKERDEYSSLLKNLDLSLDTRLRTKVRLLSGGQRQALTLLMATLSMPKLLLLDEHTAALDPKTAIKIMEITTRIINDNHLTTLMITHNMKQSLDYGDRLLMVNDGKITLDISGEEKKNLTMDTILSKFYVNA